MAEIGGLGNNNNPGLQIFDETPGYGTPVETLAVAPCDLYGVSSRRLEHSYTITTE
ncbi:hypothetical protein GX50_02207 [[Emmonsia] crescens]|uniref:Uncharacterized protein n=1 Tax=[Emmonsia] crescens TaxID=73230 RepID=A0A2B7ZP49_9EURO|nr:hypothetical protein GX50_02207 [Emmonsia crescens]